MIDRSNWSMQLNLMHIARQYWDGKEIYPYDQYYQQGEKFKLRLNAVRFTNGEWMGGWFEAIDLKCGKIYKWVR